MNEHTPTADTEVIMLEPIPVAVRRETVQMDQIRNYFDDVYGAVAAVAGEQGVGLSGPAVAVYRGMPTDTVDVAAGFPTQRPIEASGMIAADELPGGLAARHIHRGSYDGLAGAYQALVAWMEEHGHTPGLLYWEVYVTEPSPEANPDDMVTEIVWPLATHE